MNQVRVGIIGTGGMGQGHAAYMNELEECQLTAICDIEPDVCKQVSEQYGVPGFERHTDLLDSGLVDLVLIATPHYDHPPIAIDAFQRGIHVLSEKPIAVTVSAADAMIKAARKSRCTFGVMYQMRTEARSIAAKRLIDSGALGEVYRTSMIMGWYRTQAYYDSGTWRATWTGEGGGVLINQAPHYLDIFAWLGGLPSLIRGGVRTRLHDIEVEDEAWAELAYPNGAHGYLYASVIEAPGTGLMEFCGNEGKLVLQGKEVQFWRLKRPIKQFTVESEAMWASPEAERVEVELPEVKSGHNEVTRNVARAILYGEPLIAPGAEGLMAMELINGIIYSGRRGRPTKVPVSRRRYDRLIEELKASSRGKERLRVQRVTDPNL